jgi:hypothetical protein
MPAKTLGIRRIWLDREATWGTGVSAERQRLGIHRQDSVAVAEGEPDQDDLH